MSKKLDKFESRFPERLKKARGKLPQERLAEMIHRSRPTVSSWENGISFPDVGDLARICDATGCDFGYFISEFDTKNQRAPELAKLIGISESAADKLLIMAKQESYILPILSLLIEDEKLLENIGSAALSTYKDGYINNLYVRAKTLYNAEKTGVFEEIIKFIDDFRRSNGLNPL